MSNESRVRSTLYAAEASESRKRVLADIDEPDPTEEEARKAVAKNVVKQGDNHGNTQ